MSATALGLVDGLIESLQECLNTFIRTAPQSGIEILPITGQDDTIQWGDTTQSNLAARLHECIDVCPLGLFLITHRSLISSVSYNVVSAIIDYRSAWKGHIPGQQLPDPVDGMISDPLQDIAQVEFRIHAI